MLAAVSPYHLTTREPAAMAALLLADAVVTLLPAPAGGRRREDVQRAAARTPAYLRMMESWRWSAPLWQAGVVASHVGADDPWTDVLGVCQRIESEQRLAPLRDLVRAGVFEDDESFLDAVSRDVLKAGPDPGITVPVTAGLDVFAARRAAAVARSEPSSVVQRAEAAMGTKAFTVAVPVLLQAGAERMLEARAILGETLGPLRDVLAAVAEGRTDLGADVQIAAREYGVAFAEAREDLLADLDDDDEDDVRAVEGAVAITGMVLPADAALSASLSALRALGRARTPREGEAAVATRGDELASGRPVFTLLVRVMGRGQQRR